MPEKPLDVTEAELAVLRSLWEHGPSSTRQLAERLYEEARASHAATVLKLLERLENKLMVTRDGSGNPQVFSASIQREDLIDRRLEAVADSLCDGSRIPLLMHLVDPGKLSPEEIATLKNLIEELGNPPKPETK